MAEAVGKRLAEPRVDLPKAEALQRAHDEISHAYDTGRFDQISRKSIRYAPWALFHEVPGQKPLISRRRFANKLLSWLVQVGTARVALNLAQAYLYYYRPDSPLIELMRARAVQLLEKCQQPKTQRLLERSSAWGLLEKKGPATFADKVANASVTASQVEEEAGLSGTLANSGFIEYAFIELCAKLQKSLGQDRIAAESLERLAEFGLTPDASDLRFGPRTSATLAHALLLPFKSKNPTPDIREKIKGFLLSHFGDPRLDPGRWREVDEAAETVLRRWLVAGTLDDFFRLLDESAKSDKSADRHWRYRKAFWSAYLEAGAIEEAWVALGPGVRYASRKFLSNLSGSYADLSGAQSKHAVLIFQIGGLTVTEWSHSGSYRVWLQGNRKAPQLYRKAYARPDLVKDPSFSGSHHGSENGRWQETVEEYLRKQTGLKFSLTELMPR